MTSDVQVTQLLHQATDGDTVAIERLFSVVYDELRRLAQV
ncbi:MAG: RNA polymerase subunit sigma-70, partial [Planctomycetota bacterium]